MKEKTKGELLIERLDRIKKNSEQIMKKMDNQITSMQGVKDDLNNKSERITDWTNRFQSVISSMGQMFAGGGPFARKEGELGPRRESVREVCKKISSAKSICILTGAGVSKNSGIPTFRDKDGLYSNNFTITSPSSQKLSYTPEEFLTLKTFKEYPEEIWKWCHSLEKLVADKNPGPEHEIINLICLKLKKMGKEVSLVTTNIDSLHYKALERNKEGDKYELHQIHGHFRYYLCSSCRNPCPPSTLDQKPFECPNCKSPSPRPNIMFFDQKYDHIFDPSNLRAREYDLTMVVGTSLQTGLSIKIATSSKIVIEINPKCVVESGEVYRFQDQCEGVLVQFLAELELGAIGNRIDR